MHGKGPARQRVRSGARGGAGVPGDGALGAAVLLPRVRRLSLRVDPRPVATVRRWSMLDTLENTDTWKNMRRCKTGNTEAQRRRRRAHHA